MALRPPGMYRYNVDADTFMRSATCSTVISGLRSNALATFPRCIGNSYHNINTFATYGEGEA